MNIVAIAILLALLLTAIAVYCRIFAGWRQAHQATLGALTLFYGMWLALGTGSVFKLLVPGVGSVALGSAAGAGVGFLAYLAIGTVGVATGGVGIAVGAVAMMTAGAFFGGVGGAAGAALVRVPLVSPIFWTPVVLVGLYLVVGAIRKPKMLPGKEVQKALPPDA